MSTRRSTSAKGRRRWLAAAALGVGFLLTCLLAGGPRALVDWRAMRAVALQSDDWGLAGFVPAAGTWDGLEREELDPGQFPAVYWESTLESADVVDGLAAMLAAHRGRDGVLAVFQPNYVMSSLGWDDADRRWLRHDLPDWPAAYERPGLWRAVKAAEAQGVWHAEFHAFRHYDSEQRRSRANTTAVGREATRRGVSLFPGSEQARELAPWRPRDLLAAELDSALAIFKGAFGRAPGSVIAPDYTWHAGMENLWAERGLTVIQAKREQRNPEWLTGRPGRLQKYFVRHWERWRHPGRLYLERNCRLEPVQSPDAQAVVDRCVDETRQAWRRGQPAVVETHRVNFSHTDSVLAARGAHSLSAYLDSLTTGQERPVFVADTELAGLYRRGTSWRVAGDRLILRNGTHAGRVVAMTAAELNLMGAKTNGARGIWLSAGEVRILTISSLR